MFTHTKVDTAKAHVLWPSLPRKSRQKCRADTCPAPLADNARCPRRPWPVEYSLSSVTDSGSEPTFSGKTSPM